MKKIYKISLISVICVVLLLCSTLPAFAATPVYYKGATWTQVDTFDRVYYQLGDDLREFGYVSLPYSQNYFGDSPPVDVGCVIYPPSWGSNGGDGAIHVPVGYYLQIDFKFYVTYKLSVSDSWRTLPVNYLKSSISYNDNSADMFWEYDLNVHQEFNSSQNRYYNFGTGTFRNTNDFDVYVSNFSFVADSLPDAYAYYVQATRVYYRLFSPEQLIINNNTENTDKIVTEIGSSTEKIENSINQSTNEIRDDIEGNTDELKQEIQSGNNELKQEIQAGSNQVTDKLDETTNEILHGYESTPDQPAGSESVGELDSIEQQLQSSSKEGMDTGLDLISSVGDTVTTFNNGLMFFVAMSNRIMEVEWITSILTMALALGIVAFLLNISGQILTRVVDGRSSSERSKPPDRGKSSTQRKASTQRKSSNRKGG